MRRAHRNGVTLIGFLAIPKSEFCCYYYLIHAHDDLADRENEDTAEFRQFRRELFHGSLTCILETLRPGMTKPEVIRYGDGHYRQTLFGLGPYIADYPEQALLCCIVQGWCPKCTAKNDDLDGTRGRRTHALTEAAMGIFDKKALWNDYGIVSGIMVSCATSIIIFSCL